jgi:fatty acid desaturase
MSFAFFHDAAHGALGLPPRWNDMILMVTSAPLLMSGHGQRQLHLRHHARPLAADDLEGAGALQSLWWAAVTAPMASVHMRVMSFSAVNASVRPWLWVENGINIIIAVVAIASGHVGVQCALLVMLVLQLTMNAWASHIPHRAPHWLLHLAGKLAWTRSPVVLSLVFHLEHHAQRVPNCALSSSHKARSPNMRCHGHSCNAPARNCCPDK